MTLPAPPHLCRAASKSTPHTQGQEDTGDTPASHYTSFSPHWVQDNS